MSRYKTVDQKVPTAANHFRTILRKLANKNNLKTQVLPATKSFEGEKKL
jgi:hypothetical protein